MLDTALRCFQGASRCECDSDEEEWLIHYMLGKIAEKRRQAPGEFLQLYKKVPAPVVGGQHALMPTCSGVSRSRAVCLDHQAAHYLHEEAARYPRKIHYHNPPDLAMEALEVSWR